MSGVSDKVLYHIYRKSNKTQFEMDICFYCDSLRQFPQKMNFIALYRNLTCCIFFSPERYGVFGHRIIFFKKLCELL